MPLYLYLMPEKYMKTNWKKMIIPIFWESEMNAGYAIIFLSRITWHTYKVCVEMLYLPKDESNNTYLNAMRNYSYSAVMLNFYKIICNENLTKKHLRFLYGQYYYYCFISCCNIASVHSRLSTYRDNLPQEMTNYSIYQNYAFPYEEHDVFMTDTTA